MTDLAELMREVRYLRDRQDIADCISLYCRGLDRLDADALRTSYHKGALDRHGPFYGDRDTFVPWAIALEAEFPGTHHSVTTHICEVDGDEAHAESYCIFFVSMPGGKTIGAGAARYIDRLERRDGRWAISGRVETMDCSWEMPASAWLGDVWNEVPPRRDRQDLAYQRPLVVPARENDPTT